MLIHIYDFFARVREIFIKKPCPKYFSALQFYAKHRIKIYSKGVLRTKITDALHLKDKPKSGDNLCRKIDLN